MERGRLGSSDASAATGDGGDARRGERIGPYEVLHPVARGGMATVWAVRDTRDGSLRAMKLLLPMANAEEARTRFRREFRALSRLNHPNVLQVFEWGLRGNRPWYTMELLSGEVLRDCVEAWRALEPEDRFARARSVLVQVARALAYIHDRGLVHRDVTPANIMVLPDGRAKLMDFGVVKDTGSDVTAVGEMVGTVAYISPEQIVGDHVDARADLYSLGAVLYLMLTGVRPFVARTLQGYLEKHLHQSPRPPREVEPLCPPQLDEICMRLLEKEPGDRYASATHLLNVLGEREIELGDRWPPRTVGRTLLRARMREALDDLAQHRTGAAILLTGTSGTGKTRVLDDAEAHARRLGLPVARGRCRTHDRPFGAFVGVYRALAHDLAPPVLKAVIGGHDDGVVRERYPVISAFRDLVVDRAPAVIVIDALERADPATVEMLEYLVRNTLALAKEPVVFLLAQECAPGLDTVAGRQLAGAAPVERHELGPFEPSEVEELVLSMVRSDATADALAARLHSESDGSPAYIADMLRGLATDGVLVKGEHGWRLTILPDDVERVRLPMPASLRSALAERIEPLPPDARELAAVLAAARTRLDLDTLVDAARFDAPPGETTPGAGLDEDRVMEALDVLVEAGLVEEAHRGDVDTVELAHGRMRDVLLEGVTPERRRELHRRLGEALERQYRDRAGLVVEELAWQFEQAGLAPKAYSYLVLTATRHLNRSLYEESLAHLDRALKMEPTARPLMRLEEADRQLADVYLARSQALYHLGRWSDALEAVRRADDIGRTVQDPRLQSRILAELGSQLRNQGLLEDAERALRSALDKAAAAGDGSLRPMPLYQLGALLWGAGELDRAEELWKEALATAQRTGDERMLGYGWNGLGILAICRGSSAEARTHLEHSAELFERLGMLAPLSIARVNLVELYLSTGMLRKALALAERTVAQAQEVHHAHGMALGLAYRAQVLLELGRVEEALQNAREALRLVRELGTAEDEVLTLATLVRVDLGRGAPDRAVVRVEELLPLLEDYDSEGIAPQVAALHAQALARVGRHAEALATLEASEHDERQWPNIRVRTDLARATARRLLGQHEVARGIVEGALAIAESNGYRFFQLVAHQELIQVIPEPEARARHARIASALARSLAANLPRPEAKRFLDMGWGEEAVARPHPADG